MRIEIRTQTITEIINEHIRNVLICVLRVYLLFMYFKYPMKLTVIMIMFIKIINISKVRIILEYKKYNCFASVMFDGSFMLSICGENLLRRLFLWLSQRGIIGFLELIRLLGWFERGFNLIRGVKFIPEFIIEE